MFTSPSSSALHGESIMFKVSSTSVQADDVCMRPRFVRTWWRTAYDKRLVVGINWVRQDCSCRSYCYKYIAAPPIFMSILLNTSDLCGFSRKEPEFTVAIRRAALRLNIAPRPQTLLGLPVPRSHVDQSNQSQTTIKIGIGGVQFTNVIHVITSALRSSIFSIVNHIREHL